MGKNNTIYGKFKNYNFKWIIERFELSQSNLKVLDAILTNLVVTQRSNN